MNQFKRAQVIMLPTDNAKSEYNQLWLYKNNILYNATAVKGVRSHKDTKFQELYIISDDEIKECDYVYDSYKDSVYQATKVVIHNMKSLDYEQYLKKIIATTDTSLNLPQPSQQFIEKYIESYNKGEVIINVLVEYEELKDEAFRTYLIRPKTNNKDNTITIKKLKDSWSRKEVINNLKTMHINLYGADKYALEQVDNWIKENL